MSGTATAGPATAERCAVSSHFRDPPWQKAPLRRTRKGRGADRRTHRWVIASCRMLGQRRRGREHAPVRRVTIGTGNIWSEDALAPANLQRGGHRSCRQAISTDADGDRRLLRAHGVRDREATADRLSTSMTRGVLHQSTSVGQRRRFFMEYLRRSKKAARRE